MSERTLPPLLEMDDELDRLERKADADVSDGVAEIRTRLDEYDDRESTDGSRGSLLDDIDGILLRLRERLSGDADQQAEALQNRIRQFRDSRGGESETLSLSEPRFESGGATVDAAGHGGQQVDVVTTVVNAGEQTDGLVRTSFYDESGSLVRRVDCAASALDAGEQRNITATVTVPKRTAHYDISVVDAET